MIELNRNGIYKSISQPKICTIIRLLFLPYTKEKVMQLSTILPKKKSKHDSLKKTSAAPCHAL